MSEASLHATTMMGTVVSIQVLGHGATPQARDERGAAIARAIGWFAQVEAACSRFDPASELVRLTRQVGVPVPVSALLYEAVQFAHAVAEQTGGAFDPTVGQHMMSRGHDREFRSGRRLVALHGEPAASWRDVAPASAGRDVAPASAGCDVAPAPSWRDVAPAPSWRDVSMDASRRTITLHRPMHLDLGAVAKGLAIDLAATELRPFASFAIDAGGDLYVGGTNAEGAPWKVGIRHPRATHEVIDTVRVSDCAVCTSGDYERADHLLDPRTGHVANALSSVTVIAPSAMVADALATAVFVLGTDEGMALLARHGVEGLVVGADLTCTRSPGFPRG